MFDHIFDNDSIHTQNAYEVELRIRAREEQRFMLVDDLVREEAGGVKRTSNPVKARLAGIFSRSKIFLQAVVSTIRG